MYCFSKGAEVNAGKRLPWSRFEMMRRHRLRSIVRLMCAAALSLLILGCPLVDGDGPVTVDIVVSDDSSRTADESSAKSFTPDSISRFYAKAYARNTESELYPLTDSEGSAVVAELVYDADASVWKGSVELRGSGGITILVVAQGEADAAGSSVFPPTLYYGSTVIDPNETDTANISALQGYALRDVGPSGGYIFYEQSDLASLQTGWRYLEAAPEGWFDSGDDPTRQWGLYKNRTGIIQDAVGCGVENTCALCRLLQDGEESDRAAQICSSASCGDCREWFLPSFGELELMFEVLHAQNPPLGGFSDSDVYWSSSELDAETARWLRCDGTEGDAPKNYDNLIHVRPARRF